MPATLNVTAKRDGEIGILQTDGYITDPAAEAVAEEAKRLIEDGVKHLVLNLENSRIANSMGISILIEIIEERREKDGKVIFCCVTPILTKTFQIMDLLKVAKVCETEDEAVQMLQDGA